VLISYETSVYALIQAPSSPQPLIPTGTIDSYINTARLQVAAQGACIRQYLGLPLVAGQNQYPFAALTGLTSGVAGVYNIRQLWFTIPGAGTVWIPSRPFEYLGQYGALNNPTPKQGQPSMWAQFGQGENGSIFVDPFPDLPYACNADTLGVPTPLVTDATPEAIPPIWTLAVPFYAAWLALMQLQRDADADKMFTRFQQQMALARNAANPDITMENWSQAPDPEMANRLAAAARERT
jgi:hypothetical protein